MKFIKGAVTIYVLFCVALFAFQRHLQYFPNKTLKSPKQYNLTDFNEEFLVTQDKVKILAWYKAPQEGQKIIIYFHGNAGNLGNRAFKFKELAKYFGVLAISYRGYAKSESSPSEEGLLKDAMAATDFLIEKSFKNTDFIFYGESLGSGVAIQHAAKINPAGLILESPFSSILSVAQNIYWYVPVKLLLRDRFESIKYSPIITSPVIIFHGHKDKVVPFSEGRMLYESFKQRKELVEVENAGHIDFAPGFLLEEINSFF